MGQQSSAPASNPPPAGVRRSGRKRKVVEINDCAIYDNLNWEKYGSIERKQSALGPKAGDGIFALVGFE